MAVRLHHIPGGVRRLMEHMGFNGETTSHDELRLYDFF